MCDNNTFIRLLAAAQSAQPATSQGGRKNGQTAPAASASKMPAADLMMWQQLITAQAQAQMMAAYQQQLQQQQQQGLGEIFRQLGEMTAKKAATTTKKEEKKDQPTAGATATIKEGAELKLEAGEVPKPVAPAGTNVLEQAMWRMLAAQLLQQQNALTKTSTSNGLSKKDNGVLDLSHKHGKAEPSTSAEGTESSSTTPHEGQEHGKKRAPPTEGAARLPIQLGWRRQTCIRSLTASGVRGDVVYYAPCGKKLSSYAEVIRYLMKNPCPAITRDNFSFSSKLMIGEFIYPKEAADGEKIITKLKEEEVVELINHLVSQKPMPKVAERKHKEPSRRSATPEDINDLYDLSENAKAHDEEDKQKWSREPMDDLLLTEIRPLPELTRIPHLRLSGEGLADALMVYEFCHNFADVLSMKRESLPSLEELVAGLEGDAHHIEKILELTRTLFSLILEYPGLPGGKRGHTVLGQSLADVGMCRENYTELMIMFLNSRCSQGQALAKMMESRSFEQLNGEEQASILAFFCNELVCCRNIVREIENNLEEIGKLKGERWLRDGKARALRAQQKRKRREEKNHHEQEEGENVENSDSEGSRVGSPVPHANNKKFTPGLGQVEILTEEEEAMTVAELDQVITGLKLESEGLKDQINGLNNRVRTFPFGWDRYHRQYWQLPHMPTVLVESMESAGLNNPACNVGEVCSKDPKPYTNPEPESFMDPDVFTVVEDLIDEVVLAKIAPEKRKRKKCRRIENSCKRGWWLIAGREQLEAVKSSLHGRGIRERCLHRLLCKNWFMKDVRCTSMALYPVEEHLSPEQVASYELNRVRDAISSLEHRIADAMLGVQGWMPLPPTYSTEEEEESDQWHCQTTDERPEQDLAALGQRLLQLETIVERRYLRQNFYSGAIPTVAQVLGISKPEVKEEEGHKDEEMEDEEKDKAEEMDEQNKVDMLATWRAHIQEAIRPSQLMLAVQCLESSIAWERSISEACCQICRTSGQPDDLLLCDGCQMGYHMSCFKPKLEAVPEGNYYCPRCREHAGGKPICVLCQKEGAPIYPCKKCYNFLHLECTGQHTPDRPSEYFCPACEPKNFERKVILRGESEERGDVEDIAEPSEIKDFRRGTKRKAEPLAPVVFPAQMNMDLCRTMLDELEQQPSVGPFLEPVDMTLVPGYREIIANPIDISTIRNKVDSECYDTPEDFATDLELMFNNCRTFNEDDSPVGIAGHTLQKFFSKRWRQIKYNYSKRLRRLRPN